MFQNIPASVDQFSDNKKTGYVDSTVPKLSQSEDVIDNDLKQAYYQTSQSSVDLFYPSSSQTNLVSAHSIVSSSNVAPKKAVLMEMLLSDENFNNNALSEAEKVKVMASNASSHFRPLQSLKPLQGVPVTNNSTLKQSTNLSNPNTADMRKSISFATNSVFQPVYKKGTHVPKGSEELHFKQRNNVMPYYFKSAQNTGNSNDRNIKLEANGSIANYTALHSNNYGISAPNDTHTGKATAPDVESGLLEFTQILTKLHNDQKQGYRGLGDFNETSIDANIMEVLARRSRNPSGNLDFLNLLDGPERNQSSFLPFNAINAALNSSLESHYQVPPPVIDNGPTNPMFVNSPHNHSAFQDISHLNSYSTIDMDSLGISTTTTSKSDQHNENGGGGIKHSASSNELSSMLNEIFNNDSMSADNIDWNAVPNTSNGFPTFITSSCADSSANILNSNAESFVSMKNNVCLNCGIDISQSNNCNCKLNKNESTCGPTQFTTASINVPTSGFQQTSTQVNPNELPKKENNKDIKMEVSSGGTLAHLVAIDPSYVNANKTNPNLPTTPLTNTINANIGANNIPLFIAIEGKLIPVKLAQIQMPTPNVKEEPNSDQNFPKQVPTERGSVNDSTNSSNNGKNFVKIAPLPSLASQQGSCIMIAGLALPPISGNSNSVDEAKTADKDNLRTHLCTYPGCNKSYTKSSHLKTHYRYRNV